MKPKFRRLVNNALPAFIIVPAMIATAPADVLQVSDLGSINILPGFTSAASINANGGSNPTAPLTVAIAKTATLTGDIDFEDGIRVSVSDYTIDNFGSLSAATRDGIRFEADRGTVNNSGSITGVADGIKASNGLILNNVFVPAPVDSELKPDSLGGTQATITTTNGSAIAADNDAEIFNWGIISSTSGTGITVGDNALIENKVAFSGSEDLTAGSITGGMLGISAGDGLILKNSGSILGIEGSGLVAMADLELTNETNAEIRGNDGDGVMAQAGAEIINRGTIFGTTNGINISTSKLDPPPYNLNYDEVIETPVETRIENYGAIEGGAQAGIDGSEMVESVENWGTIGAFFLGMDLKGGNDSIRLNAGSTINGNIDGGEGCDTLTFTDGARFAFDSDRNIVNGSVLGMEKITKNGYGTAIIRNTFLPYALDSESMTLDSRYMIRPLGSGVVQANEIFVNSGALYINGGVGPNYDGYGARGVMEIMSLTSIIADGGEIGGINDLFYGPVDLDLRSRDYVSDEPNAWLANITLRNGGGISAGSEPPDIATIFNSFPDQDTVETRDHSWESPSSIGRLAIQGDITHQSGDWSLEKSSITPLQPAPTYIRVDINPGTAIWEGVNSDLIVQTGLDSVYDMTGAEVWIAPTNQDQPLTAGSYTIIDSQQNIVGFNSETTKIGVVVRNESAPDDVGMAFRADFGAPSASTVSYDTILGNYFSKLVLRNPVPADDVSSLVRTGIEGYDVAMDELGTDLVLEINYDFSALPGLTENQSSFGQALDVFIESPGDIEDAEFQALGETLQDLAMQDLPTAQAALATLDPSSSFGVVQSVVNSNYRLHRLTQNHLAAVRGSSQTSNEVGASSKDAKGTIVNGPVTTTTTGRGNVWGTMSYDRQDFEGNLSEADFDGDTGSFTAGVDWLVAPQLILGLVFDGSKSDLDSEGSNSTDIDSFRAAVYGTWGGAMGFYSDFLAGYGDHNLNNTKSFDLFGNLSSETDASSLQAMWTVGYTMGDERIKHGPFAGLEYQQVDVDGYTQEGLVPISVNDYDVDSFRALVGYRVDATLGKFNPYAAFAYAHEFEDGSNTASATVGGVPFTVEGAEQSSAFLISVGTGYALTQSLALDLGYRGEIATDDGITNHGVSLGFNYAF
jgi:uncharacterized protein YhjY with autotransporter beta-barrel domain